MVRVGIIGAGPWGRKVIAAVRRLDGLALAGVASSNPETADVVGNECAVVTDWRRLVVDSGIDAVFVATPPASHAEIARAAIDAGKAVMIEKPLTLDLSQARQLLDFAENRGAVVLVDHIHLYSPAYRALKHRIRAGGSIRKINSAGGNIGPFRTDTPMLWDYGPHDVAMCLDLMGCMPKEITARVKERRSFPEGEGEVVEIRLTFPDEVTAEIEIGNAINPKRRYFQADTTRETLVYDDTAEPKLSTRPSDPLLKVEAGMPLDNALLALADATRARRADVDGLRLGVRVVEVLYRCQNQLIGRGAH